MQYAAIAINTGTITPPSSFLLPSAQISSPAGPFSSVPPVCPSLVDSSSTPCTSQAPISTHGDACLSRSALCIPITTPALPPSLSHHCLVPLLCPSPFCPRPGGPLAVAGFLPHPLADSLRFPARPFLSFLLKAKCFIYFLHLKFSLMTSLA